MRYLIIGFMLLLSACGGSDNDPKAVIPADDDSIYVTQVQLQAAINSVNDSSADATQIQALQQQIDTLSAQLNQLQLIGRPGNTIVSEKDTIRSFRMMGEPTLAPAAATIAGQFGPCANMGVLEGKAGGTSTLTSPIETFQTCNGYEYSVSAVDGSLQSISIEFDGPNCTGNAYASIGTINSQVAINGAVFVNPLNKSVVYVSAGSQKSTPIIISFSDPSGVCSNLSSPGPDTAFITIPNNTSITGVSNSPIMTFGISAP